MTFSPGTSSSAVTKRQPEGCQFSLSLSLSRGGRGLTNLTEEPVDHRKRNYVVKPLELPRYERPVRPGAGVRDVEVVAALLRRELGAGLARDEVAERADLALELARLVVRLDPVGDIALIPALAAVAERGSHVVTAPMPRGSSGWVGGGLEAWLTEVDMAFTWVGVYGFVGLDVSFLASLDESWGGAERVAAVRIELDAEAREGGVMWTRAGAIPRSWICALFRLMMVFARCLDMVVKENVRHE